METAIDASVLWAIFKGESTSLSWVGRMEQLRTESRLTICEVALAEVGPLFPTLADLQDKLDALGIEFDPIEPETAFRAGQIFREYRRQGGPRRHLIPDFLIGAHALCQAGRIAAEDRGYLRRYFPKLGLVHPL